jgi:hypothetical protein
LANNLKTRSNYETWRVHQSFVEEKSVDLYWRDIAEEAAEQAHASRHVDPAVSTVADFATNSLAERLRSGVIEGTPWSRETLYPDLVKAALDHVNWKELASHLLVGLLWPDDYGTTDAATRQPNQHA